jgi:hypothetical protein
MPSEMSGSGSGDITAAVVVAPPQPLRCCHRAAAVALCTVAKLRAAATAADAAAAAVPPPCFHRHCAGAQPVLLTLAIVARPREDDAGENFMIFFRRG